MNYAVRKYNNSWMTWLYIAYKYIMLSCKKRIWLFKNQWKEQTNIALALFSCLQKKCYFFIIVLKIWSTKTISCINYIIIINLSIKMKMKFIRKYNTTYMIYYYFIWNIWILYHINISISILIVLLFYWVSSIKIILI